MRTSLLAGALPAGRAFFRVPVTDQSIMNQVIPLSAALACAALPHAALAQGVATETELAPVVVSSGAPRRGLHLSIPGVTTSKSAEQLREQNLVNPEDALQYAPNTTIRKRYIGDRNALIAGRSFGTSQPSRALVYLDGYLISNFLGRFDAPRWNMISPEAIERVDVLYGPYSALLPGNSIGTTVAVTQRRPSGRTDITALYAQDAWRFGVEGHAPGGAGGGHQQRPQPERFPVPPVPWAHIVCRAAVHELRIS